jgi:hypothetical protein
MIGTKKRGKTGEHAPAAPRQQTQIVLASSKQTKMNKQTTDIHRQKHDNEKRGLLL